MFNRQLITIIQIASAIGIAAVFMPWLDVQHYDYYESIVHTSWTLNGLQMLTDHPLFSSSIRPFPVMMCALFVVLLIRYSFRRKGQDIRVLAAISVFASLLVIVTTLSFNHFAVGKFMVSHVVEKYSLSYAAYVTIVAAIVILLSSIAIIYLNRTKPPITIDSNGVEIDIERCPYCGSDTIEEDSGAGKFCRNCGARLK